MLQGSTAASAPPPLEIQEDDLLDPLWRLAGDVRSARALIVGEHSLDLMCGLIRRGCLAATVLRSDDKPDATDYDVVVAPFGASSPPDRLIRLARRSLRPMGRLIVGANNPRAAVAMARRLRLNGFAALRSDHAGGLMLLRADLRRAS